MPSTRTRRASLLRRYGDSSVLANLVFFATKVSIRMEAKQSNGETRKRRVFSFPLTSNLDFQKPSTWLLEYIVELESPQPHPTWGPLLVRGTIVEVGPSKVVPLGRTLSEGECPFFHILLLYCGRNLVPVMIRWRAKSGDWYILPPPWDTNKHRCDWAMLASWF